MKGIKGYEERYSSTKNGKIWSHRRKKFLKPKPDKDGYLRVVLFKDGERKDFGIHRLVGIVYIDNLDNKPQINHKNGIKTDNRVKNLEWTTAKENIAHSIENNLKVSALGERHGNSILTNEHVIEINGLLGKMKQREIANKFGIHHSIISDIKLGKTWGWLTGR